MKKYINFKSMVIVIIAAFAVISVMVFGNDGADWVPLDPDGGYSYPDYCIGHEEDFVVNANSLKFQQGLYVEDIKYIGNKGDFADKNLNLGLSTYDQSSGCYYNESLNLGFKLPDGWEAVCPTPKADEEYTYLYDFGAVSPDGTYTLVVKYHDLKADGIKVKNTADYYNFLYETDPYYKNGYRYDFGGNIFVADRLFHLREYTNSNTEKGRIYVAWQVLSKDYAIIAELYSPYENRHKDVWDGFFNN